MVRCNLKIFIIDFAASMGRAIGGAEVAVAPSPGVCEGPKEKQPRHPPRAQPIVDRPHENPALALMKSIPRKTLRVPAGATQPKPAQQLPAQCYLTAAPLHQAVIV